MKKIHYNKPIPISDICDNYRFFYIDDIKKTCELFSLSTYGKKTELLENIRNHIKNRKKEPFYHHEVTIIKKTWRNYWKKRQWRGPGFLQKNKCTNIEDFYTLDTIEDTTDTFFFSYRDVNNIIFFFDIRSFYKLIENRDNINPYNRQIIPTYAIDEYIKRKTYLEQEKLWKLLEDSSDDILTQQQKLNLRIVGVVTELNLLNIIAGGIDIDWFIRLSTVKLKKYYAVLEDIWTYRAALTKQQKLAIIPNGEKMKKLFSLTVKHVITSTSHILNYEKMLYILMDIIETLITSSPEIQHRITAANYVIIALTEVSPLVASVVPWLAQTNY